MLILNIFPDQFRSYLVSHCPYKIPITPKLSCPKLFLQPWELLKYLFRTDTLQNLYNFSGRILRWSRKKNMNMINFNPHNVNLKIILLRDHSKQLLYPLFQPFCQNVLPIFWNPYKMIFDVINCMFSSFDRHAATISYFPCLRHEGFDPRPDRRGIPPYFL